MVSIVAVVTITGVGIFLLKGKSAEDTASNVTPTQEKTSNPTTIDLETVEFTVEGGSFYFKPNEIRVKKGQKVEITFNNKEGLHDFVIDELNVQTEKIGSNQTTSVEFTPNKAGTFEFYCSVGNHRTMGMKGNLVVEE